MVEVTLRKVRKLFKDEISNATASRRISLCRDALGKQKHQPLSMTEFCKYFDITIDQ
jgi:hypothetical protein